MTSQQSIVASEALLNQARLVRTRRAVQRAQPAGVERIALGVGREEPAPLLLPPRRAARRAAPLATRATRATRAVARVAGGGSACGGGCRGYRGGGGSGGGARA